MEKKNLGHLMVDIETLGTDSNSVICSLAAVEFCLETGVTGRSLQINIDIKSCLNAGLKIDAGTLKWWFAQGDEARIRLFKDVAPLKRALRMFFTFIADLVCPGYSLDSIGVRLFESRLQIWGNSNRFDLGILENAYKSVEMDAPWMHWNERDVRTLVSFAPHVKKSMPFDGVKHDALADCYHQIKYCSKIFKLLTNGIKENSK